MFELEEGVITDSSEIISGQMFKDTLRWIAWSYKKRDTQNILEIEWVGNRDKNKDRRSFLLEE